jgi:hypothetical protein
VLRALSIVALSAISQLVGVQAAFSQGRDDRIRASLWYARQLVAASGPARRVVFLVDTNASSNAATDSVIGALASAFRRAGLPITSRYQQPGPDTLLASVSVAIVDSATTASTFYRIYSQQTYCGPAEGSSGVHAISLRCTRDDCHLLSELVTGTGLLCRQRM